MSTVSNAVAVQFPATAIDSSGNDVLGPLQKLLQGVCVLGDPKDSTGGAFSPPDQATAIIESGATGLTKVWATVLGSLGGATAVTTAATGFWNSETGGVRIALLATTGAVVAAVVIGLAVVIAADVRARGEGARSIYAARARIASKFLEVAASTANSKTPAAPVVDSLKSANSNGSSPTGPGGTSGISTVALPQKTAVAVDGVQGYLAHAITSSASGQVQSVLVDRPGGHLQWVDNALVTATES